MPAHIVFGPVKDKIPSDWTSLNIQGLASTNVAEKFAFVSWLFCIAGMSLFLLFVLKGNFFAFFLISNTSCQWTHLILYLSRLCTFFNLN